MSLVKVFSTKQKMNGERYTEGELIGVYNDMSKIIWSRYFVEAHWCKISNNRLIQENNSATLLGGNGKVSRSKRNKHINTRHLFVTYRVVQGELEI